MDAEDGPPVAVGRGRGRGRGGIAVLPEGLWNELSGIGGDKPQGVEDKAQDISESETDKVSSVARQQEREAHFEDADTGGHQMPMGFGRGGRGQGGRGRGGRGEGRGRGRGADKVYN
jgi:hypothetical protein